MTTRADTTTPLQRSVARQAAMTLAIALALTGLVAGTLVLRQVGTSSTAIVDAVDLVALMDGLDYRIEPLRQSGHPVPRVMVQRLPAGMAELDPAADRKRTFLRTLLPLVLAADEAVLEERRFLLALADDLARGEPLSAGDGRHLAVLARSYRVEAPATATPEAVVGRLLTRVDVVPVSLALAQGAVESAWGTSRFAREGNALFGQSSWTQDGMAPIGHDVAPYRIAAFASLEDCVAAYVANLNSHPAYASFRRLRAEQRARGEDPDGRALAATLLAYAETGQVYVATLRAVIDSNRLDMFDHAELEDGRTLLVIAAR